MTTAFAAGPAGSALPTLPSGWPIGSYDNYEQAQHAVDHLADHDFPVGDVTIVGVQPLLVERVATRLTWGRVLRRAAMSGAWFGLFVGLLLSLLSPDAGLMPLVFGLAAGTGFAMLFAAINYGSTRGKRDFLSSSQIVAQRYDVLCQPRHAERGRDMLAELAARQPQNW